MSFKSALKKWWKNWWHSYLIKKVKKWYDKLKQYEDDNGLTRPDYHDPYYNRGRDNEK